tara:strand:- start:5221 stop:5856 length:636 start_codon:yes stop_codon:yes gene_type:complete
MKITYAITVKDEFIEIQRLISHLLKLKRYKDEIVILYDQKNGDNEIALYLTKLMKLPNVQFWRGYFDGDFSVWKNQLSEYCSGDYIFQIDADEIPNTNLISSLPSIIEMNPENDVFLVPRVNTVDGLTDEHIKEWKWNVNEDGWVNWPDYQWRIWKNIPTIKWVNKVHEKLDGFKTFSPLPKEEDFSLSHPKDIKRQERQNNFYNDLINGH